MPAPPVPLLKTCATQEPTSLKVVMNVYLVTPTNTLPINQPIAPSVKPLTAKVVPLVTLVNAQAFQQAVATISTVTPLVPMPAPPLQVVLLMPALPSDALNVHQAIT